MKFSASIKSQLLTWFFEESLILMYADKPTLPTLLKFPPNCSSPHCINTASRIGKEYWKFGILLLEDDNGHIVDAITRDHRQDSIEMITLKILQKWINGVGQKPVSWYTLVQVLYDVQLNELAREILEYIYPA